ncbi:MAG: HlyD family secretion protein [Pirellula sp.]|jgi:multidrug resistance efflux pump|nr:HlyD family secretion protein [Pirellula sp.]
MATTTEAPSETHAPKKRMIRLRPNEMLGERFPAMHLVRSGWFARVLSRTLVVMLVILLISAVFLPWQQTSRGEGQVIARLPQLRLQPVEAPAKGIISSLRDDLREGSFVEEGEVVMVIKPFAEDAERLNEEAVKALTQKLESYQTVYQNNVEQVKSVRDQAAQEIAGAEAEVRSANNSWQKALKDAEEQVFKFEQAKLEREAYDGLVGDVISPVEYSQLENKELSELKKLESLQEATNKAYNDLAAKERDLEGKRRLVEQKILKAEAEVQKAQTDVNTAQKELNEVLTKQGEFDRLDVKSPSRGRIQAIRGQAGTKSVKEGDLLFEVVPDTEDLAVELTVRGVDAPLIHVDDPVRLQFEGWPAIQFIGWPSVAVGTFAGKVIAINPTDSGKGVFKIIVGPLQAGEDGNSAQVDLKRPENIWPGSRYLRQGVRANGWVILKTVPLGFEIWRQMNGFPITIADREPTAEKDGAKDPKMPKMK